MRACLFMIALTLAAASPPAALRADDAGNDFFERKIRPVLVEHCYECHSGQARKIGGGLRLDHRQGTRAGGDSGPAIEPGQPAESLLLSAIRYTDDALKMPPKGKLPDAIITDIETWISLGAPDPREQPAEDAPAESWKAVLESRRDWWSLQPVREPAVPDVSVAAGHTEWAQHPVDRFLLAKLEAAALTPAAPADPYTLARRASLVLTGLPPSSEQEAALVQAIEAVPEDRQASFEKFVDSLLASPHFGERWARHWMDVVRFSETHGNEWNYEVHHALRYRDYLIRAFNEDVPFDQLVREQIAGDLLPKPRWNAREQFNESVIGTAFYRFGEANHDDCISLRQIGFDLFDNQIDTLTKAFQATTVACARCHDHKLDAVSMSDYYGLLGILRSSRLVSHTLDAPEVNAATIERLRRLKAEFRRQLGIFWAATAADIGDKLLGELRLANWLATGPAKPLPMEDPLEPWRALLAATPETFADEWRKLADRYRQEDQSCTSFNEREFLIWADFSRGDYAGWQVGGQALRDFSARPGDFVVQPEGDALISAILPAGCFTHAVSDKLNGTLRSPVLPPGKRFISFQVFGRHGAALRLVSNNCQLNYKNYRGLTMGALEWVTFAMPDDRDSLRTYAELMTMFDNPKFPDQLSALGGDQQNYRLPWEEAAANPRSHFGVTRVVLHDCAEPPKPELSHLRALFADPPPATLDEVAARYTAVVQAAIGRWAADQATDEDARWLDAFLKHDLLRNRTNSTPGLTELTAQYRQTESELRLPRVAPGVADAGPGVDQPVLIRGDCLRPGELTPRRYLEVLSSGDERFVVGSGRLALAEQIASPQNSLTARVMVNRLWHHVFGTGIVRTVDDFGHVGELPSHPELLDYLAARFVAEGWSVKRLLRSLVLTQAFQQDHVPSAEAQQRDPQNRLLQHYPARRMEAEAIRDAILATSSRLDRALYGMSVQPYREQTNADRRLFPGPLDGAGRRGIYIKNNLMESPKFLGAFNFPGGKVTQGRRDLTNVPAQALALLNDPFVLEQADVWAARLVARGDEPVATRIGAMFRDALGRPPRPHELIRLDGSIAQLAELHQVAADDVAASRAVWKDVAHAIFNLQEFIYIP